MHLAIINASPRVEAKSNTARIIRTFLKGFEKDGNTAEVWHLSDRKQWENAKEAYEKNIKSYGRYDDAVKYIDPRKE